MCGITAIVNLKGHKLPLPEVIHQMTDSLRHRGPDDEGYVLFDQNNFSCAGGKDTQPTAWHTKFPYTPTSDIAELSGNFNIALVTYFVFEFIIQDITFFFQNFGYFLFHT